VYVHVCVCVYVCVCMCVYVLIPENVSPSSLRRTTPRSKSKKGLRVGCILGPLGHEITRAVRVGLYGLLRVMVIQSSQSLEYQKWH
jgi:hypothetical protein